jgi:integrase
VWLGQVDVELPDGERFWHHVVRLHRASASHQDGPVKYTAHELRHVCASLLIASGATDMQVTNQMGHSKIERPRTSMVTCSPRIGRSS